MGSNLGRGAHLFEILRGQLPRIRILRNCATNLVVFARRGPDCSRFTLRHTVLFPQSPSSILAVFSGQRFLVLVTLVRELESRLPLGRPNFQPPGTVRSSRARRWARSVLLRRWKSRQNGGRGRRLLCRSVVSWVAGARQHPGARLRRGYGSF